MNRRRLLGALVLFGSALGWSAGCAFDDSTEDAKKYTPAQDASLDSTGGGDANVMPMQDLCGQLGGTDAVGKLAGDMLTKMSADCRIGAYLTALSADQQQHHRECFTTYLQSAVECKNASMALVKYAGAKDSKGVDCKAVPQAHQALNLTKSDYAAFEDDLNSALAASMVATPLRQSVLSLLRGQPGIYNANKNGNYMCDMTCMGCVPVPDGGVDARAEGGTTDAAQDTGTAADSGGSTDAQADGG